MQCFSVKFWKRFFFWCSYSFWKDLSREYLVVLKFLLEVPAFKENVLFYIITAIKVRDHLLTLLQVITILAALFYKWMNLNYPYSHVKILSFVCSVFIIQYVYHVMNFRLLILINSSYMCDILLCRLMIITSIKINC